MEYDFVRFYENLKSQPLSQKISIHKKYEFKKPEEITGKSPGIMSSDEIRKIINYRYFDLFLCSLFI